MVASNRFYKKSKIVENKLFSIPKFAREELDFSDVEAKEFIVQFGDRLDFIAEQLYGDPKLWKAIALFNDIEYMFELEAGDKIFLPFDINQVLKKI